MATLTMAVLDTGAKPCPRQGHASVLFEGRVFMFGGRGDGVRGVRTILDDFFCFDSGCWFPIPRGDGIWPSARHNHSAVEFAAQLVIFGGSDNTSMNNDLYVYSLLPSAAVLTSTAAVTPTASDALSSFVWTKVPHVTKWPPPRHGHTAVVVGEEMIVFGGHSTDAKGRRFLNDVWALNLSEWTWRQLISPSPAAPPGRSWHSCAAVDAGILVFGGFVMKARSEDYFDDLWVLNLKTGVWTSLFASKGGPHARNRNALVPLSCPRTSNNWCFLLFGGNYYHNKKGSDLWFDDAFLLHLSPTYTQAQWTRVPGQFRMMSHHTVHIVPEWNENTRAIAVSTSKVAAAPTSDSSVADASLSGIIERGSAESKQEEHKHSENVEINMFAFGGEVARKRANDVFRVTLQMPKGLFTGGLFSRTFVILGWHRTSSTQQKFSPKRICLSSSSETAFIVCLIMLVLCRNNPQACDESMMDIIKK